MSKIEQLIDELRSLERAELRDVVISKGKKTKNGFEYRFKSDCPIIAAYCGEEPADVVILSILMKKDGQLIFTAEEKLDRGHEFTLDPDNIFLGQISYVVSEIV